MATYDVCHGVTQRYTYGVRLMKLGSNLFGIEVRVEDPWLKSSFRPEFLDCL